MGEGEAGFGVAVSFAVGHVALDQCCDGLVLIIRAMDRTVVIIGFDGIVDVTVGQVARRLFLPIRLLPVNLCQARCANAVDQTAKRLSRLDRLELIRIADQNKLCRRSD